MPSKDSSGKPSKKVKLSAAAAASSPAAQQLASYQRTLSASTDLNALVDLLALLRTLAFPTRLSSIVSDPSENVLQKGVALLVHALQSLLAAHKIPLDAAVDEQTGRLRVRNDVKAEAARQVRAWIAERWNDSVQLMCCLLGHEEESVRQLALKQLMNLQRDASSSLSTLPSTASEAASVGGKWSGSPFKGLMLAILAGPPDAADPERRRTEATYEDVRSTFAETYMEAYDDVRFATCREIRTILSQPPPSTLNCPLRSKGTQLLLLLTAIPTIKADLNTFLVPQLSKPPAGTTSWKKSKTKKQKVVDGGGSEEESNEEEESDMEGWFSDSDDERSGPRQPKSADSGAAATKVGAAAAKRRARKAPAVGIAIHSLSAQRAVFSAAWLAVLLAKRDAKKNVLGGSVPLALSHEVLVRMHAQVLPHLVKPRLLVDWLVDCLEAGGATSLLALNGLYTLMISHNLLYPSFYGKLYALLLDTSAPFLHVRYRARFLRLLDTFLSSSHLPATLIASFAKRLSRATLRASPAAAVSVVPFVWNLCKRHKGCMEMIHRDYEGDRLSAGPAGVADTYDPLCADPLKTGALESSLWELAALGASAQAAQNQGVETSSGGEYHYLHGVSTLARILAEPFTKERWDLEDFLDVTYGTLFETETARTLKPPRAKTNKEGVVRTPPVPALAYALPASSQVFPDEQEHANVAAALLEKRGERGQKRAHVEGEDAEEKEAREAMEEIEQANVVDTRDACAKLWAF